MTLSLNKKTIGNIIFWVVFCFVVVTRILMSTAFPVNYGLFNNCILVAYVLLLFKLVCFDELSLVKKLVLLIVEVLVFFQAYFFVYNNNLMIMVMLTIGVFGIDYRKILKAYLIFALSLVFIMTVSATIGIIPDYVYYQLNQARHSLGSIYCTDYMARWFYIFLLASYLYIEKAKVYHFILSFVLVTVLFLSTLAKLDYICILLILVVFGVHSLISANKIKGKFVVLWDVIWDKLFPYFMPLAAVAMTIMTLLYSSENNLLELINNTITGRLFLGKMAFSNIGVNLFGANIYWVGVVNQTEDVVYNFVDCAYLQYMFNFGLIAALLIIAAYVFIALKYRGDRKLAYVIALISLNSMISHHLIEIAYNPFMLLLFAEIASNVSSTSKKNKKKSIEA